MVISDTQDYLGMGTGELTPVRRLVVNEEKMKLVVDFLWQLYFLQCFDTVGWGDRKDIRPVKTCATSQLQFCSEISEGRKQRELQLTQDQLQNDH